MRRHSYLWIILGLAACLLGNTAFVAAEEGQEKTYSLSLKEATELALINNFDIQLTKYDTWIARTERDVARSIYDTIFDAEIKYRDDQSKKTSIIFGSKTVDNDYNVGVSKKLPTGTTVSIDQTNNRNFTDSPFTTAPLTHNSTLGITVEQELGKNFLGLQDRGNVKITFNDIENVEYTTLDKIEISIVEVQKAYWDLGAGIEVVRVEEEMVAEEIGRAHV